MYRGGGYKVIQMGGYKVRQVGGYKVSLSLDFRMWGFIRSNRYVLLPQMRVYKVTLFFDQEIFSQKNFLAKGHFPQMRDYKALRLSKSIQRKICAQKCDSKVLVKTLAL